MKNQTNYGLAHDLVLIPVSDNGKHQVYQTNLWDVLRKLVTKDTSVDLLIGPKNG